MDAPRVSHYRDLWGDGRKLDRHWFCSEACALESEADDPPSENYTTRILGHLADPTESPQACAMCAEPAGNPLNPKGIAKVAEWAAEGEVQGDAYAATYGVR